MNRAFVSVLACLLAGAANANSLDAVERTAVLAPGGATSMTAELVRRVDGGWVISKLNPTKTPLKGASPIADEPELEKTLDRYRMALTRGDMNALSSVWLMNPAERAELDRIADGPNALSVSISKAHQKIDGDHAWVIFLQQQSATTTPKVRRKASRRGLSANDSVGEWAELTGR